MWNLASKKHQRGEVCVETIRNVLDELLHADLVKCKTAIVIDILGTYTFKQSRLNLYSSKMSWFCCVLELGRYFGLTPMPVDMTSSSCEFESLEEIEE